MEACTNPDFLRVIYFVKLLIKVIMTILPIWLIIIGTIDFAKSATTSNEQDSKTNVRIFIKRIISAMMVYAVYWIVTILMDVLGDLSGPTNFTECWKNANKETIDRLSNNS